MEVASFGGYGLGVFNTPNIYIISVTDVLCFGNSAALELVSVALVGPGQRLISYPLPAAAAAEPP